MTKEEIDLAVTSGKLAVLRVALMLGPILDKLCNGMPAIAAVATRILADQCEALVLHDSNQQQLAYYTRLRDEAVAANNEAVRLNIHKLESTSDHATNTSGGVA